MPIVASRFEPPWFLRNGHVQTILPVLLPRRLPSGFVRERFELLDGDFVDLDWLRARNPRLAIITHGLEGDSTAGYIRGMAAGLHASGWDVLAWNFRGCSGEINRLRRFYHSGDTADLAALVERAAPNYQTIVLIGYSLGGNVVLKYVGEAAPHPAIAAAAAVSAPVDLAAAARKLDERPGNRLYLRRFIKSLVGKVETKALRLPGQFDVEGIRRIRTFQEFDDRYTAPLHGFRDAAEYWLKSSSRQFLPKIVIPALLLNAQNDPFLAPECFPYPEAEANLHFYFEAPESGGHVGFLDLKNGLQPWSERRVPEFFEEMIR